MVVLVSSNSTVLSAVETQKQEERQCVHRSVRGRISTRAPAATAAFP
jgi:hypothetical protein